MNEKFNWKRLLITIGIVFLTAGAVGGATWYVMDSQNKKEKAEADKQIQALDKLTKEAKTTTSSAEAPVTTPPKDETADWKSYSNALFNLKYPNGWEVAENIKTTNSLEGLSVLADENVVVKNTQKGIAMAINYGELWGRGGACTKRFVSYSPTLNSGKLSIKKTIDKTESIENTTDYCGSQGLSGYSANVDKITWKGKEFYLRSESLSDSVVAEAIVSFEKIMNTIQFK